MVHLVAIPLGKEVHMTIVTGSTETIKDRVLHRDMRMPIDKEVAGVEEVLTKIKNQEETAEEILTLALVMSLMILGPLLETKYVEFFLYKYFTRLVIISAIVGI